jgi:hypothetical protein
MPTNRPPDPVRAAGPVRSAEGADPHADVCGVFSLRDVRAARGVAAGTVCGRDPVSGRVGMTGQGRTLDVAPADWDRLCRWPLADAGAALAEALATPTEEDAS